MLINIQFLRFIAAYAVVLYHTSKHVQATGAEQGWLFSMAESVGFAGVDIFFVISGFIMIHTTRNLSGRLPSQNFLKRRLARIYSGYWPFFFLALAVISWSRPEYFSGVNQTASFFLWPIPLNKILLPVSWTLSYELYFYFAFAILVFFIPTWRTKILIGLFILVTVYNLERHFISDAFSAENMVGNTFSGLFLTSPYLSEFFAGAVIAAVAPRVSRKQAWILIVAGTVGFLIAGCVNFWVYDLKIEQGYHIVPRVLIFGIPSSLLLWGMVQLERHGYRAPVQFSLYTGGASYAIYLSHTLILISLMQVGFHSALHGMSSIAIQAVFLLLSGLIIFVSVIYYRLIERKLHIAFKRLLRVDRHR